MSRSSLIGPGRFVSAFAALLITALLAGCAGNGPTVASLPRPVDYEIHGIDVSKYQGTIDWAAVRSSNVRFAWIKATEGGDYLDEKFEANWAGAEAAGIPRGAYHFMYWCRAAEEQAAWFLSHVPKDPYALPPVLDVEWNPQSKTCPRKPPRDVAIQMMKTILVAMEKAYGKKPVIYTSVDFHRDVMVGEFTRYPIWVRSVKYFPSVKYGDREWHFWQHTAEGQIRGITGYVDRNCFNGTPREWQAWLSSLPGSS